MKRLRLLMYIGGIGSVLLILLAIVVALEVSPLAEMVGHKEPSDPGVALATAGLAIFTGLLFFAGAVAASIARQEIVTSVDVNSANLALQMDNRFVSDRALRIRHGAVSFLAETKRELKELKTEFDCEQNISPYSIGHTPWHGLNSDLIDLLNYFDWIGYLASEKPLTIDKDVIYQKFGPWIINYYQICEDEIKKIQSRYHATWPYLRPLYHQLIAIERARHSKTADYSADRTPEEIKEFLRREHVRSHRGSNP
jgi:hypothetical protein